MWVIAFDADKHDLRADGRPAKPTVLAGERKLIEALGSCGEVYSAEWSLTAGKGIDDLLTNGATYRLVDRYAAPVPRPRVPRPCAAPGSVDGGDDLQHVREETATRIGRRFRSGYANTVALLAPPPGTAKTGSGLRAQESSNRNVAWGMARHGQAEELTVRAATEPCQCGAPRETCAAHRITLHHDYGRNQDNCGNWDVVEAAREAGYGSRVGLAICGTKGRPICPLFSTCEYQAQSERPGSHVAAMEMVVQRPTFTDQMSVVIMDDLDSGRLITGQRITPQLLERSRRSSGAKAVGTLVSVLDRALGEATRHGSYHRAAYDVLDAAARGLGSTLEAVLAATPPAEALSPLPTVEAYQAAMPGQLLDLIELLHEEFALYRTGMPFTSGLRIHAGGIEIARLRAPVAKSDGTTALTGKAVLVLSSTPDPVLRQWMRGLHLEVLKEYFPRVSLPSGVRVIQDTSGFYGKGNVTSNDPVRLIARAREYLRELLPERPAVVTHKILQRRVALDLGIPIERVLYFGNARGSNALRDADALLVIGTPGMDPADAYWNACAAYRARASLRRGAWLCSTSATVAGGTTTAEGGRSRCSPSATGALPRFTRPRAGMSSSRRSIAVGPSTSKAPTMNASASTSSCCQPCPWTDCAWTIFGLEGTRHAQKRP